MTSKRVEYKAHQIEVRDRSAGMSPASEDKQELLLDSQPLRYLRLPDGHYVLENYAYEPADDLEELAKRYIDHRETVGRALRERTSP